MIIIKTFADISQYYKIPFVEKSDKNGNKELVLSIIALRELFKVSYFLFSKVEMLEKKETNKMLKNCRYLISNI